mgnify:CR=1 FL=1
MSTRTELQAEANRLKMCGRKARNAAVYKRICARVEMQTAMEEAQRLDKYASDYLAQAAALERQIDDMAAEAK